MSFVVSFFQGLSLNLISTLFYVRKLNLMEVHTPSPLRTIYAHCRIDLDSDVLRNLVPFVQFEKREKQLWRSVTFSKIAGLNPASLAKVTLLHECFSRFLNCINGTKSCKTSEFAINM